jgi:23S rRNA (uracil1939-C5)-methyltransferase
MDLLNCEYITQCSGCQIAHLEKSQQVDFKKNNFIELWKKSFSNTPEIQFIRPLEQEFRDRADLTVQNTNYSSAPESDYNDYQKIGFYKKDSRDILNVKTCPLMTKNLSLIYSKLRTINFPIKKGSLRIRVSPQNKSGLWIDFSNEDIKKLLDEKTTLEQLTKIFDIIEIGQKRKKLALINEQFKLTDPELNEWFETYDKDLNSIALQMNVGSFSQTGFATNKILISELIKTLIEIKRSHSNVDHKNQKWLELCSGSGNLTMPLISIFKNVIATELDENAAEALKKTANKMNLSEHLQVEKINIHKPSQKLKDLLSNLDGILADPPRSGLQGFLEVMTDIERKKLPKNFVYVSCFAETLISDLKVLKDLGYDTQKIVGVDQFPHSTHCEWIVYLSTPQRL